VMTTMIGGAAILDPVATRTVARPALAMSTAASNRMTTAEVRPAIGTRMTTNGASGPDPRTTMTVGPADEAGTETPKDTARPRANVGKRVDHLGRAVAVMMTTTTGADPAAGMMMMTTMIVADPAAVTMTMTPGGVDAAGMAIPRDIRRLHANGEKNADRSGRVLVPRRMTMIVAVDPAPAKMRATAAGLETPEAMRRLLAEAGKNGPRDLEATAGMTTMIAEDPGQAMMRITAAGSAIRAGTRKQRVVDGEIATDSCCLVECFGGRLVPRSLIMKLGGPNFD
jgi:hypothetical protein